MPAAPAPARSKYFALYTTAKRLAWDPAGVDLSADAASWEAIRRDHGDERAAEQILRLCNLFLAGERSVTDTLAPFCGAVPRAGLPVDMELHLAAQLLEEAKHWEFFDRYFAEVLGDDARAAATLAGPSQAVLVHDLAGASDRLRHEDDPARLRALLVEGITHYMGVVEAMLARTGYEGAHAALARRGWLPGLRDGFRLIRRDEGRHVAFGIHAVRDLVAAEPSLAAAVEGTFERNLPNVLATVQQFAEFERPLVDVAHLTGFALAACRQFLAAAGLGDVDAAEALALEAELAGSE